MPLGINTPAAIGGSIGGAAVIAVMIWWYADKRCGIMTRTELMYVTGVCQLGNSATAASRSTMSTGEGLLGRRRSLQTCGERRALTARTLHRRDNPVLDQWTMDQRIYHQSLPRNDDNERIISCLHLLLRNEYQWSVVRRFCQSNSSTQALTRGYAFFGGLKGRTCTSNMPKALNRLPKRLSDVTQQCDSIKRLHK